MEMDTNGDGKISLEEFKNLNEEYRGQAAECLDATSVEEMFNKIDTNNSGFIEYSEFLTAAMDRSMQLSQ